MDYLSAGEQSKTASAGLKNRQLQSEHQQQRAAKLALSAKDSSDREEYIELINANCRSK